LALGTSPAKKKQTRRKKGTASEVCSKCGERPPQRKHNYCQPCKRAYDRERYLRQRTKIIAGTKKRVATNREKLMELKAGRVCVDCDVQYGPHVLQFDHRDPSKKHMNVSDMIGRGYAWKKIVIEIEKCDVVCANCHAERTFRTRGRKKAKAPGGNRPEPSTEKERDEQILQETLEEMRSRLGLPGDEELTELRETLNRGLRAPERDHEY